MNIDFFYRSTTSFDNCLMTDRFGQNLARVLERSIGSNVYEYTAEFFPSPGKLTESMYSK